MPGSREFDNSEGDVPIRPSLSQRLRNAFLKPPDPDAVTTTAAPQSIEELQAAIRSADDKERLVGLFAAPIAAAVGFLVITALIDNDPSALLKNGLANPRHVNVSIYHDLTLVLLGMSMLMLVLALLRKRLFLGIVMALYGLAIFNLHYWGFGIPFLLFGSWLLVRAYRLQQSLKQAMGDGPGGATRSGGSPPPSKRYTPPTSRRRAPRAKPDDGQESG